MPKAGFLWKLYAAFALIVIFTAALIGLLVARSMIRETRTNASERLLLAATMLTDIARQNVSDSDAGLEQRLRNLGSATETRLTLIDPEGVVLADSMQSAAGMDNHLSRPEVRGAVASGRGEAERNSASTGEAMAYLALPVQDADGLLVSIVRSSMPLQGLRAHIAQIGTVVALSSLAAALLGLLLAWWLAGRLTRPLVLLTADAEALAQGRQPATRHSMAPDEIGSLSRAMSQMSSDLGDRIETIEKERRQLLAILGGMVEGVIAVDAGERIVHMNEAAGRMLGAGPDSLIGTRLYETVRITALVDAVRGAMQDLGDVVSELRLHTDARDRVVELYASPLTDSREEAAGAVVVLHDVTALRRVEDVRRDFVANVSHELKTPLAVVRAVVETLLDEDDMDLTVRRNFLQKVDDQTRRLTALVDDLLSLSRAEAQSDGLSQKPTDVRHPARAALSSLATAAAAKNIELNIELGDIPLLVAGDHEALRQAIGNLLENAIKYTPDGGRVWIAARVLDGRILIEVGDTGVGIPAQEQDRIFERFYRVDKARSRDVGGTGLGLSIVKHVVLNHGGSVSVTSRPGQGSVFVIELPPAVPS